MIFNFRLAPAFILGVLNISIIIEFKKISRKRRLISMNHADVSCFPSQSLGDYSQHTSHHPAKEEMAQILAELNKIESTSAEARKNSMNGSTKPSLNQHENLQCTLLNGDDIVDTNDKSYRAEIVARKNSEIKGGVKSEGWKEFLNKQGLEL